MQSDLGQPESESTPTAGENPTPHPSNPAPEAAPAAESAAPAPETATHTAPLSSAQAKREADVRGYEAALAEALKPAPEKPAEPEPGTPAPEAEAPPEAEAAAPEPEPEPEPAETVPPTGGAEERVPDRIRLGGLSEKDRALTSAAVLLAKAENISVPDAMARLSGKPAVETPAPTPEVPAHRDAAAIEAEIAALDTEWDDAGRSMDTVKMADLRKRERALQRELNTSREAASTAQAAQEREFSAAVDRSKQTALAYYPQAADANSALSQKAAEIADRLEAQGNELVFSADAPLKIFQMAANELGIAPADPGKPTNGKPLSSAPLKPQPVPQRAAVGRPATPAVAPASGAARTTQPDRPQPAFGPIRTVHDYEQAVAQVSRR